MRKWRGGGAVLTLVAALAGAACDSGDQIPNTPTPTPATVTETYSGTISVNAAINYTFQTKAAGTVTARLSSVLPDNTVSLGLALGTWNGVSCAVVIANDSTREGNAVVGSVSGAGQLCVRIYDVGNLPAPATFEVVVIHP